MSLADFFKGKVIEEKQSEYNGKICVISHMGEKKIVANNLLQSGSIIANLWQKPLKRTASLLHKPPENILLLGLGGGTVLKLLHKRWPEARITAVEIDPIMVHMAQKHFKENLYPNVKIITADAFIWLKKHHEMFELILVDIFCGNQPHPQLLDNYFGRNLKNHLSGAGIIVTNQLFFGPHKEVTELFVKMTEQWFSRIQLVRNLSNLFVIVKKE